MTTRIMPRKPPSDGWALSLVWLAAAARLLPHFSNFTPVGAAGLFSGARLRGWRACVVPLAAMLLSDVALSLRYGWPVFVEQRQRQCMGAACIAGLTAI